MDKNIRLGFQLVLLTIVFLLSASFVSAADYYQSTVKFTPSSFTMSSGCSGTVSLAPSSSYSMTVYLYKSPSTVVWSQTYTSGEWTAGSEFETSELTLEKDANYRFRVTWNRVKDNQARYDHGQASWGKYWKCITASGNTNQDGTRANTCAGTNNCPWTSWGGMSTSSQQGSCKLNNGATVSGFNSHYRIQRYWCGPGYWVYNEPEQFNPGWSSLTFYSSCGSGSCGGSSHSGLWKYKGNDYCRHDESVDRMVDGSEASGSCAQFNGYRKSGCGDYWTYWSDGSGWVGLTSCSQGTQPPCPTGLCSYTSGTEYTNWFTINAAATTTTSFNQGKISASGPVEWTPVITADNCLTLGSCTEDGTCDIEQACVLSNEDCSGGICDFTRFNLTGNAAVIGFYNSTTYDYDTLTINANEIYTESTTSIDLSNSVGYCGANGGVLTLNATTMQLEGTIYTDTETTCGSSPGAGSGGGITLTSTNSNSFINLSDVELSGQSGVSNTLGGGSSGNLFINVSGFVNIDSITLNGGASGSGSALGGQAGGVTILTDADITIGSLQATAGQGGAYGDCNDIILYSPNNDITVSSMSITECRGIGSENIRINPTADNVVINSIISSWRESNDYTILDINATIKFENDVLIISGGGPHSIQFNNNLTYLKFGSVDIESTDINLTTTYFNPNELDIVNGNVNINMTHFYSNAGTIFFKPTGYPTTQQLSSIINYSTEGLIWIYNNSVRIIPSVTNSIYNQVATITLTGISSWWNILMDSNDNGVFEDCPIPQKCLSTNKEDNADDFIFDVIGFSTYNLTASEPPEAGNFTYSTTPGEICQIQDIHMIFDVVPFNATLLYNVTIQIEDYSTNNTFDVAYSNNDVGNNTYNTTNFHIEGVDGLFRWKIGTIDTQGTKYTYSDFYNMTCPTYNPEWLPYWFEVVEENASVLDCKLGEREGMDVSDIQAGVGFILNEDQWQMQSFNLSQNRTIDFITVALQLYAVDDNDQNITVNIYPDNGSNLPDITSPVLTSFIEKIPNDDFQVFREYGIDLSASPVSLTGGVNYFLALRLINGTGDESDYRWQGANDNPYTSGRVLYYTPSTGNFTDEQPNSDVVFHTYENHSKLQFWPGINQFGPKNCTIQACDPYKCNQKVFWVDISNTQDLPYFVQNLTNQTVRVNETLLYDINCSDPDIPLQSIIYSDTFIYADIHNTTGLFNYSPQEYQAQQNYTINVTCDDGIDTVTQSFVLEVLNYGPILNIIDQTFAYPGNSTINLSDYTIDNDSPVPENMNWSVVSTNASEVECVINVNNLTMIPAYGWHEAAFGLAYCSVNVTDGLLWDTDTFAINVTGVVIELNILNIENRTTEEDTNFTMNLTDRTTIIKLPNPYTYSVIDENTSQVDCVINADEVLVAPSRGWWSRDNLASCTIRANDTVMYADSTFLINVTWLNDPPENVSLISPINQTAKSNPVTTFNWTEAWDDDPIYPGADNFTYEVYIDNWYDFFSPNVILGPTEDTNITSGAVADGLWYWTVRTCDHRGLDNSCSFADEYYELIISNQPPVIVIDAPLDNEEYGWTVDLLTTPTPNPLAPAPIDTCVWNVTNSTGDLQDFGNLTSPDYDANWTTILGNPVDGNYTFYVWCNDSVNNIATDNVTFVLDNTNPSATIYTPNNGEVFGPEVPFHGKCQDDTLDEAWYKIYENATSTQYYFNIESSIAGTDWTFLENVSMSGWPQGRFDVHLMCDDGAGNLRDRWRYFIRDSVSPAYSDVMITPDPYTHDTNITLWTNWTDTSLTQVYFYHNVTGVWLQSVPSGNISDAYYLNISEIWIDKDECWAWYSEGIDGLGNTNQTPVQNTCVLNRIPYSVATIANQTQAEDTGSYSFYVNETFVDDDNDDLDWSMSTYEVSSECIGYDISDIIIEINNNTGLINLTFPAHYNGLLWNNVTAHDPFGGTNISNNFYINITPVNDLPIYNTSNPIPDFIITNDTQIYNLTDTFYDIECDDIDYTGFIENYPNMTITVDNDTAIFNISGVSNWIGSSLSNVTSYDYVGAGDTSNTFNVTYIPGNVAPVFDFPLEDQFVGHYLDNLSYNVNCSDNNTPLQTIVYSTDVNLTELPSFTINSSTGLIEHDPQWNQNGSYSITVFCYDSVVYVNDTFIYTIYNTPPIWDTLFNLTFAEHNNSEFDLLLGGYVHDQDGEPLEITITDINTTQLTASINSTGYFNITNTGHWYGYTNITLRANDTTSPSYYTDLVVWVNVTFVNDVPILNNSLPNVTIIEDEWNDTINLSNTYFYDIEDGINLSYTYEITDNNVTIDFLDETIINITAVLDWYGEAWANITATDSLNANVTSNNFLINFTPVNDRPRYVSAPGLDAFIMKNGTEASQNLTLHFYDPEGDDINWTYGFNDFDNFTVSLNNDTGNVTVDNIISLWEGDRYINFTAYDWEGAGDTTPQILVRVYINSTPPYLNITLPILEFPEDTSYSIDFEIPVQYFLDNESDPLTYSYISNDSNVQCNAGGVRNKNLTVVPVTDWFGVGHCEITVTDGALGYAYENITYNVTAVNDRPRLNETQPTNYTWQELLYEYNGVLYPDLIWDVDNTTLDWTYQVGPNITVTINDTDQTFKLENDYRWWGESWIIWTACDHEPLCNNTANISIVVEKHPVDITNTTLYFNNVSANRTYEYQTTAEIYAETVLINDTGLWNITPVICLDIELPDFGPNYICGNQTVAYNWTIEKLNIIDEFSDGSTYAELLWYYNELKELGITLFNTLRVVNATVDVVGTSVDATRTFFDGWNSSTQIYNFTTAANHIMNFTMDANSTIIAPGTWNIYSLGISDVSFDVCNDGSVEYTFQGTLDIGTSPQSASVPASAFNDCLDTLTGDPRTIPIKLTTSTLGPLTIDSVEITQDTTDFPTDVYIDIGNDGIRDAYMPGYIDDTTVKQYEFSDGSLELNCSTSSCYKDVGAELMTSAQITKAQFLMSGLGYEDEYIKTFSDFSDLDAYDAEIDPIFDVIQCKQTIGFEESYVNSSLIRTTRENIDNAMITVTSDIPTGTSLDIYLSNDNGTTYESVTSGVLHSFTSTGTEIKYRLVLHPHISGTTTPYVYNVELDRIGDYPKNISIDVLNDGSIDYTYDGIFEYNDLLVQFNQTQISDYTDSCDVSCEVPINLTYIGPGIITFAQVQYEYDASPLIINEQGIYQYQHNSYTPLTEVTTFNDSTTNKQQTLNASYYIDLPKDVIISDVGFDVEGGYIE